MSQILILTGSSRPNSAGSNIVEIVKDEVSSAGYEPKVVDVRELHLPFFDSEKSPSSPDFSINHDEVKKWSEQVLSSDAVIFVTPEYNGSLSAIQKNAIDWLYKEWADKPVALVGYGWHGAMRAHANAKVVFENVKAKLLEKTANFNFMKDLGLDGIIIDNSSVKSGIHELVETLANSLK